MIIKTYYILFTIVVWIWHYADPGYSVADFIISYLNYVALVCTGMWLLEGSWVSWQPTGKKGGKVCRFNFAGLRSRSFSFLCLPLCCCTCLLFILRSEKEESGWWEKPTFSPLWGCSCILPNCLMKGTFVLQWNISPFTSSWCGLPSFFIFRKTLRLSFFPP